MEDGMINCNTMWDKNKIENILINKHDNKSAYLTNKTLPLDNKIFCPLHFGFVKKLVWLYHLLLYNIMM